MFSWDYTTQKDREDHAVLLVGWGTRTVDGKSVDYWIAKNSWSTSWWARNLNLRPPVGHLEWCMSTTVALAFSSPPVKLRAGLPCRSVHPDRQGGTAPRILLLVPGFTLAQCLDGSGQESLAGGPPRFGPCMLAGSAWCCACSCSVLTPHCRHEYSLMLCRGDQGYLLFARRGPWRPAKGLYWEGIYSASYPMLK